jgi:transglutaminase-like putative cysteine protease
MLVHQITYQEVIPGKYPIETLVAGNGDCDLFAEIAASILEAGGIPTVLLFYRIQQYMEIGVDLGSDPTEARVDVYNVNVQNVP